jgi:hypothetical protein
MVRTGKAVRLDIEKERYSTTAILSKILDTEWGNVGVLYCVYAQVEGRVRHIITEITGVVMTRNWYEETVA